MIDFIKRQWFRLQVWLGWKTLPPPKPSVLTPNVIADQMMRYLDNELAASGLLPHEIVNEKLRRSAKPGSDSKTE